MVRKIAATIAVAIAAMGTQPTPVYAGAWTGGATEITQILNNIELLIQSITEEMQYLTQVEQLAADLAQLATGSDSSLMADVGTAARLVGSAQGAMNALDNLQSELGSLGSHAQTRWNMYAASGLDWQGYVERERALAYADRKRASILTRQEESAIERVKSTWQSYQRYQREITTSEGEHQSLRILNGQMNSLIATMNETLQLAAVNSNASTEREFRESMEKTERVNKADEAHQELKRQNQKARNALERLQTL